MAVFDVFVLDEHEWTVSLLNIIGLTSYRQHAFSVHSSYDSFLLDVIYLPSRLVRESSTQRKENKTLFVPAGLGGSECEGPG